MLSSIRLLSACLMFTAACATGTLTDESFPGEGGAGGSGGSLGEQGGGGFGEGGFGEGGTGGSSTGCSYDPPNQCPGAETILKVAGDEGDDTRVKNGNTSMWFKVLISEENNNFFKGKDLSYTVDLASPPGMVWNLVVREGAQDGPPNCTAPNKPVTSMGSTETVSNSWNDDQPIGGEDDSVWLSIGVIYNSGMLCDEAASWTLTVRGNT